MITSGQPLPAQGNLGDPEGGRRIGERGLFDTVLSYCPLQTTDSVWEVSLSLSKQGDSFTNCKNKIKASVKSKTVTT